MRRHLVTALLLAAAGCAEIGGAGDPGLDQVELEVDNGILLDNGMNLGNGIDLGNGLTGPHYAPPSGSGLEQWIDVDPAMRVKILRYLVECALPAGVQVQLLYRGQLTSLGAGVAGLGPGLESGLMPVDEQEAVSSCLLARVNGQAIAIGIEIVGPPPLENAVTASLARREGAFFGNLFAETPEAYTCLTDTYTSCRDARGCRPLADGSCDCGLFALEGGELPICSSSQVARCGQLDYVNLSGEAAGAYYIGCATSTRLWDHAITAYVDPLPAGATCSNDMQCLETSCIDHVCSAPLPNGSACEDLYDCASGYCSAGTCGKPTGYACKRGSECASGTCSGKRCL